MNFNFHKNLLFLLACSGLISCTSTSKVSQTDQPNRQPSPTSTNKPIPEKPKKPVAATAPIKKNINLPVIPREFRAAWVATVANINWPSKNNLSTEAQKAEAIQILDELQAANFNAVIFQVRPSADALYPSDLEPWSYYLTGATGTAPSPYYDPLEFWITEAHKRNIELHAWLNPFRAHHSNGGTPNEYSSARKYADHVVRLKNGMYWFDPADERTQEHASKVVRDLVKRYDLDAIHFDDYFYPYKEYNGGVDFPDHKTFSAYQRSGGTLSRADWRRGQVNKFVKRIYDEIKEQKKEVKFGISPFGIWKPGYPADIKGSSQYDELFADAKLWLNQGWVDYYAPQLYWPMESTGQRFSSLLQWWKEENTKKRHLWPGINTVGVKVSDRTTEIMNQVKYSHAQLKDSPGVIHWSVAGVLKNPSLYSRLQTETYDNQALIPETPWLGSTILPPPAIEKKTLSGQGISIQWTYPTSEKIHSNIIYLTKGKTWEYHILPGKTLRYDLNKNQADSIDEIVIRSVSSTGILGDYMGVEL